VTENAIVEKRCVLSVCVCCNTSIDREQRNNLLPLQQRPNAALMQTSNAYTVSRKPRDFKM
jgi:hypothetical protein